MNEAQQNAAMAVEKLQTHVRELSTLLSNAEAALKRAEARLRTAIRRDPDSWQELTPVKDLDR